MYGRQLAWVQRVPFELYIKHGTGKFVPNGEGPALTLVEQHTNVPAPRLTEVLNNTDHTDLVMTRLAGVPLEAAVHFKSYPERTQLGADLRNFISQLRSIPNPNTTAICSANGGPVFDYHLPGCVKSAGLFQSEEDFSTYLVTQERLKSATHNLSHRIYFSHADLNPNNILISAGKLSGIVDFGYTWFYPEYWEYTKGVYVNSSPDSA
jgi:aminoglycoside phosphotransferase (APT) family kinase protein